MIIKFKRSKGTYFFNGPWLSHQAWPQGIFGFGGPNLDAKVLTPCRRWLGLQAGLTISDCCRVDRFLAPPTEGSSGGGGGGPRAKICRLSPGRFDEARQSFRQLVTNRARNVGSDHPPMLLGKSFQICA
jgi:hypothetical protein